MFYLFFFPPSLNHGSFYIEFSSLCVRYQRILSNVLPYLKILLRFSQVCLSILPISFFLALWDFFFLFHFIHFKCYIYPEKNGIERAYIDHFYIIQCFPNVCMCGGWGKYWRKEKRINVYEQTKWNQELGDYCLNYTFKKSNISQPRKIQCYSESLWIMKIFIILKHILQKKMVENQ